MYTIRLQSAANKYYCITINYIIQNNNISTDIRKPRYTYSTIILYYTQVLGFNIRSNLFFSVSFTLFNSLFTTFQTDNIDGDIDGLGISTAVHYINTMGKTSPVMSSNLFFLQYKSTQLYNTIHIYFKDKNISNCFLFRLIRETAKTLSQSY